MTTVAILPVKVFDNAKQRLSPAIQLGNRRALVEAMLSDALVAVGRVASIERTVVVTADRAAARIASSHGATVIADTADSHSSAAMLGIVHALTLGASRVLLMPGDCPLLDPTELEALVARPVGPRSAVIVPDRHGEGTNALLLTPPDSLTPAFGEGSTQRHTDLAIAQGTTPEVVPVPSLGLDIDTPEDLDELLEALTSTRGRAAYTRGMLNQLTRSEAG
jgi:2-phospho-L-lactate/phosphoenolpyruvate guanylyltransferase